MFAVVLVHPEIPPNTGNVIRLTAITGTELHLVEPLGFRMDDRELRRAGLDYHEYARVTVHPNFAACRAALDAAAPRRWLAYTTGGERSAYDVAHTPADVLVFGCETRGLPADVVAQFAPDARLRIPMRAGVRSLNLSNAVAVAVYEAWRQQGFVGSMGSKR
jgi:tRNA (cytidine/uridine-2'-O-)-methyltransferase